jgi:hypothetical protein
MLNSLQLKNFGLIDQLKCEHLGNINLIIGENSTGKTILLKALYSAMRTLETYKRGNEPRSAEEILADKLYWTFETEKIGELVRKGADEPLSFQINVDNQKAPTIHSHNPNPRLKLLLFGVARGLPKYQVQISGRNPGIRHRGYMPSLLCTTFPYPLTANPATPFSMTKGGFC